MITLAHARSVTAVLSAPFLLIFGTIGCGGDGLPRQGVSGSVTLGGEPLETGIITFVPKDSSISTQGGTTIMNGEYEIPRAQGLVPGVYRVVVSSASNPEDEEARKQWERELEALGPGMPPPPAPDSIPPQFGSESTLEATVTDGGANRFDFSLVGGAK